MVLTCDQAQLYYSSYVGAIIETYIEPNLKVAFNLQHRRHAGWRKTIDLSLTRFVRLLAFACCIIVICVWLKTTFRELTCFRSHQSCKWTQNNFKDYIHPNCTITRNFKKGDTFISGWSELWETRVFWMKLLNDFFGDLSKTYKCTGVNNRSYT